MKKNKVGEEETNLEIMSSRFISVDVCRVASPLLYSCVVVVDLFFRPGSPGWPQTQL